MNNQQDSNEITYEVIKLKAHHAWYEKRIAGDPSLDFYDGYDIGFNAGLKYQSNIINESIKEQDPCNYCGKTIREQAKGCNEIPCKSNYTKETKPINNEPLREKFRSVIIEEYGNLVLNSLVKKCVQVAEQYAASKLNNTIEDKWISVEDKLPEEGGRYWCYTEQQTDLGLSHFQWNCSYNETTKTFSDRYLTDGERITHWQPLPSSPLPPKPTK